MQIEKLTESEEVTIKAVWDCRKKPTLSEAAERVNGIYGKNWAPQTVSSFLRKLVDKKYLELQRNGKIYTYKVLIPESAYKRKAYKQHISFWNHNNVTEFLTEMIRNGDLTKEDLKKNSGTLLCRKHK